MPLKLLMSATNWFSLISHLRSSSDASCAFRRSRRDLEQAGLSSPYVQEIWSTLQSTANSIPDFSDPTPNSCHHSLFLQFKASLSSCPSRLTWQRNWHASSEKYIHWPCSLLVIACLIYLPETFTFLINLLHCFLNCPSQWPTDIHGYHFWSLQNF